MPGTHGEHLELGTINRARLTKDKRNTGVIVLRHVRVVRREREVGGDVERAGAETRALGAHIPRLQRSRGSRDRGDSSKHNSKLGEHRDERRRLAKIKECERRRRKAAEG